MYKLFNGDCLSIMNSLEFLDIIKNKKVVIVTDPPFNIGYHYDGYKDKLKEIEYYQWLKLIFKEYPFVVIRYAESIYKIAFQLGKFPEKVVSWVYNSNTAKQHREIAFFGVKPNFNQAKQSYKNPNDKRIKERIARGIRGGGAYMIGGTSIK